MDLSVKSSSNSFGAKFIQNEAFKKTVEEAISTNRYYELDNALRKIAGANDGDILIMHGKDNNGTIFSNFSMKRPNGKKHAVTNYSKETPEMSTLEGILELSEFGKKFEKLAGEKPQNKNISIKKALEDYEKFNIFK